MKLSLGPALVSGRLSAPASKSSMQRAVACAALAEGSSVLLNPSDCADARAALGIVQALGARVGVQPDRVEIEGGILARPGQGAGTARRVSCGESGLCIRMFSPILALLPGPSELHAEGSLQRRPVSSLETVLASLGASYSTNQGLPPVTVHGPLSGGQATIDASVSSQFLTGLLIALPLAQNKSQLGVSSIVSSGYVQLTLDTMAAFGVETAPGPGLRSFAFPGGGRYSPRSFRVEGDWSGAAFLLVAGALAGGPGGLLVEGLDLGSSQPDRAILEVLDLAGVEHETVAAAAAATAEGPAGAVRLWRSAVKAFSFDATNCPDLFPPLVALAASARGTSELRGATRLLAKESDRAAALKEAFGALGIRVDVEGDLMRVFGGKVAGGLVDSRGDHRIAMAAAVASLVVQEGQTVSIEGAQCVAKSWPTFFEDLASLSRG